jgi:hypothetical protein
MELLIVGFLVVCLRIVGIALPPKGDVRAVLKTPIPLLSLEATEKKALRSGGSNGTGT